MSWDILRKVSCLGVVDEGVRLGKLRAPRPTSGGSCRSVLANCCQRGPGIAWCSDFLKTSVLLEISPIFKCSQLVKVQHTKAHCLAMYPLPGTWSRLSDICTEASDSIVRPRQGTCLMCRVLIVTLFPEGRKEGLGGQPVSCSRCAPGAHPDTRCAVESLPGEKPEQNLIVLAAGLPRCRLSTTSARWECCCLGWAPTPSTPWIAGTSYRS